MPKKIFTQIQLPLEQPDRCADCPLLGLIPDNLRSPNPEDRFKSLVCVGTSAAITKKFSEIRASQRDNHHPLHRPCDSRWNAWQQMPRREFPVKIQVYNTYLEPYHRTKELRINFNWKS